jgi:NADH:ubiquinone oxidoreductase subunit 5 (subunit L)/multisubunit Na+/H+ antiporter MnhA subunit
MFAMLTLVLSADYASSSGWGVGSAHLIGFWFEKHSATAQA